MSFTWLGKELDVRAVDPKEGLISVNGTMGFLRMGDINLLSFFAKEIPKNGVIVEIGSFLGLSTLFMAKQIYESQNNNARIHAIDLWDTVGSKEWIYLNNADPYDVFCKNIINSGYKDIVVPRKMSSLDAARYYADGSIDMLFIDGDHSFNGCLSDLVVWHKKIKKGGKLVGHDFHLLDENCEVHRAVHVFCSQNSYSYFVHSPGASSIYEIML